MWGSKKRLKELFSPYFFMVAAFFVKNYTCFSTFEIQKLTLRRLHKNTNCYKRTPSLLVRPSLFYASCNTLASCYNSLYKCSEIHNQNFPSQINSSEIQSRTFKMCRWFSREMQLLLHSWNNEGLQKRFPWPYQLWSLLNREEKGRSENIALASKSIYTEVIKSIILKKFNFSSQQELT